MHTQIVGEPTPSYPRESRKDNGPADLYFPLRLQTSYSWRRQWHPTPVLFCLENPMDRRTWQASVHGVAKSQTRLSDFTFTFHFRALEKEMATHSSVLAWRIPGTGGAWWAAVYGVAQSWTQLKRLSSSSKLHALHKAGLGKC